MSKLGNQLREVPDYGIYGQPYQKSAIDFLHIESLEETQKLHDWTIRPHRHRDLTQFFFIEEGSGKLQLGETETNIAAPTIIVIPANEIHAFTMERNVEGHLITIADSFLRDLALMVREPLIETQWSNAVITGLSPEHYHRTGVGELINELRIEFNEKRAVRSVAIYAHLSLIMTAIIRLLKTKGPDKQTLEKTKSLTILTRFRQLCDERFRHSRSVAEYCQDLEVTERTLRRITQQFLGVPPLQLIHDRVLLEAQRTLIYSNASISGIAESLGFDDPAYFTRFFKRHMQQTPNQFRLSKWKEQHENTRPTTDESPP